MSRPRCPYSEDVDVYLLGALDPDERRAFVEHLPGCPDCREDLAAGAGLPGLLARVPEPAVDPGAARPGAAPGGPAPGGPPHVDRAPGDAADDPPPQILAGVVARVRRRRRARRALVAVTVAVALAGGVVLGGLVTGPEGRTGTGETTPTVPVAREVALPAVGGSSASGLAALTVRPWGTAVALRCVSRLAAGAPPAPAPAPRPVYVLVVRSADGTEQEVARWSPPPGQDVSVSASTDVPTDRLAGLEVRTADGHVVMASAS